MPFSSGPSQPRDWTQVSFISGRFFTFWATRHALPLCKRGFLSALFSGISRAYNNAWQPAGTQQMNERVEQLKAQTLPPETMTQRAWVGSKTVHVYQAVLKETTGGHTWSICERKNALGFVCIQVPWHLGREQEAEDQGDQDPCHLSLFLPWAEPHLTSGDLAEGSECVRRRQGCGWPAPRRTPHRQCQTALLGWVPGGGSMAHAVGQSCQDAGIWAWQGLSWNRSAALPLPKSCLDSQLSERW